MKKIIYAFLVCLSFFYISCDLNSDTEDNSEETFLTNIELKTMINNGEDVSNVDTSHITDMRCMFNGCPPGFNQDLSSWDVSNVTDMSFMFSGATSFNQDLSSWNVSNVTDMSDMFSGATKFNQDLSSWDVINVTDMGRMFSGAISFNQDISSGMSVVLLI